MGRGRAALRGRGTGLDQRPGHMSREGRAGIDRVLGLFDRHPRIKERRARHRGPATHVVILDGTMYSLAPGEETNAGLAYKLMRETGTRANLSVRCEAGIQWRDWTGTLTVMTGRGLNRQIVRTYGWLASRHRPGDGGRGSETGPRTWRQGWPPRRAGP